MRRVRCLVSRHLELCRERALAPQLEGKAIRTPAVVVLGLLLDVLEGRIVQRIPENFVLAQGELICPTLHLLVPG